MTVTLEVESSPDGRRTLIGDERGLDPVPAPPAGM
jgi:hypothetical protein